MSRKISPAFSRRALLGSGLAAGVAPRVLAGAKPAGPAAAPTAPFDTMRDYIEALEARGLVMHFDRVDQDAYEATALMYRAIDEFGMYEAPTLVFDNIKVDGQWMQGPVIANHQGHWDTECIVWGLEPVEHDYHQTYRNAMAHLGAMLGRNRGSWPLIEPVTIDSADALCKEVVLTGDDVDLTRFPFIQSNPGDIGRYVNTGSVYTFDPEIGRNFGTYRCQIKGPRKLGVNPEPGQTGWRHLMEMKQRGDKTARVSIVLGQDPVTWLISGSVVAPKRGAPIDEHALAGGVRGKPLELVRCESNDILVPAHSEMVIEGEVPLDQPMEPEGPFGEMYGYLGLKKEENFWMNVTTITHRRNPWFLNSFTGATRGFCTAPLEINSTLGLRRFIPNLLEMHSPVEATGWTVLSIDKTGPGQGLEAGSKVAEFVPIAKVVVVVDKDVNVLDRRQVMHTIGARWQPDPAAKIFDSLRGMPLDPSAPNRPFSSKIVIDATRQLPDEGGPTVYPELNRTLLEEGAPEAFDLVERKWGDRLRARSG